MGMITERPAYLKTAARSLTTALVAGLGRAQPPRISLDQDRFTVLMANGERHPMIEPSLSLDVIIVGGNEHVSRIYWEEGYDRSSPAAPICWSDNGVGPSVESLTPQNATCSGCPRAQWTKINANGNKVPWCSQSKKLAVLVAGAGDTVFMLAVPPKSMSETYKPYMAHLANEHTEPYQIVTHLTFEDKVLHFAALDWVPEGLLDGVVKIVDSEEPDVVVGAKDKAIQGTTALPKPEAPMARSDVPITEGARAPAPQFLTAAQAETVTKTNRERELEEELAKMKAMQVAETPKRGRPRREETVVGPGAIPAQTFQRPTPQAEQQLPFINQAHRGAAGAWRD